MRTSGIPPQMIHFDEYSHGPGSEEDIHEFMNLIFKAKKVIVVGSIEFKKAYDNAERGSFTNQEISRLLIRSMKTRYKGIIPVWFDNNIENCLPECMQNVSSRDLKNDYQVGFFDLMNDLIVGSRRFDHPVTFSIDELKKQFIKHKKKHA